MDDEKLKTLFDDTKSRRQETIQAQKTNGKQQNAEIDSINEKKRQQNAEVSKRIEVKNKKNEEITKEKEELRKENEELKQKLSSISKLQINEEKYKEYLFEDG